MKTLIVVVTLLVSFPAYAGELADEFRAIIRGSRDAPREIVKPEPLRSYRAKRLICYKNGQHRYVRGYKGRVQRVTVTVCEERY